MEGGPLINNKFRIKKSLHRKCRYMRNQIYRQYLDRQSCITDKAAAAQMKIPPIPVQRVNRSPNHR